MNLSLALTQIAEAVRKTEREADFLPLTPPELEEASRAYFHRGGKFIRPALTLTLAAALGGEDGARRALSPACAAELFHLFTLVHDDVIDHDTLRRGEDAAHVLAAKSSGLNDREKAEEYGVSVAVLAGDALFSRAVELLTKAPGLSESVRLTLTQKLVCDTLPKLLSGEAVDTRLGYAKTFPTENELSTVYRNKTGVLFEFCLFAGAVCAMERTPEQALSEAISHAAAHIGEAFQLTDDYLGLTASEDTLGKSALSDIREGKETFFVFFARARAKEEELAFLNSVLGNETASENEVFRARDLLLHYGTELYEARIRTAKEEADTLLSLLPEGEARAVLAALFERMIHREK